jgi:hypothetical protein
MSDVIEFPGEKTLQNKGAQRLKVEGPLQLEAYNRYCQLSSPRSYNRLHRSWPEGPSLPTLAAWAKRFKWPDRVLSYDRKVSNAVNAHIAEREIVEKCNAAESLHKTVAYTASLVEQAASRADLPLTINSIMDLQTVVNTMINASKHLETLTGGVAERTEIVAPVDTPELRALDAALKRLGKAEA